MFLYASVMTDDFTVVYMVTQFYLHVVIGRCTSFMWLHGGWDILSKEIKNSSRVVPGFRA